MTDTWGIPGPLFTGLYLGLLLIPLIHAVVRTRALQRGHAGGSPQTTEELALLTGERTRLGEVVIARLLERGLIRMDGNGRLYRIRSSSSNVLDRVALERISKAGTSVDLVRSTVEPLPAVAELEAGLAARGLVADVRKLRLTSVTTAVAYWALFVLGVVRLIAGSSTGHPVGFLVVLLLLNAVAALVGTVRAAKVVPEAKATDAGRAAAEEARRAGTLTSGAAGAVASSGLAAYPDKEIRAAVSRAVHAAARTYARPSGRSSWAGGTAVGFFGGSSCGGGGSSCGGGGGSSCGGGGGGGCGG
ncbi:TIGR04222 domain-containing membrane protein [Amycolatopsis sp., V23-08]|uniref:TIGR04222 domain-containing membrane protein n=1 Tax=Amycolatopsis heterodermiae TaxID=3110235 RepID=A0ABU5RIC3_9PSEU|nr:TIGR04222 domain-containing membrane protein [Amycolatopsis sp., V23-08]MEA5366032.1 TIGR04222 domain-containing membrane protein [Amycolatopsis sp., V23-08]